MRINYFGDFIKTCIQLKLRDPHHKKSQNQITYIHCFILMLAALTKLNCGDKQDNKTKGV